MRKYIFDSFGADVGLELHLDYMRHATHCGTIVIPAPLMRS